MVLSEEQPRRSDDIKTTSHGATCELLAVVRPVIETTIRLAIETAIEFMIETAIEFMILRLGQPGQTGEGSESGLI